MDVLTSRTGRTVASTLASVLLLTAFLTGCGNADQSAQRSADKYFPGVLTVMTSSRGTMPGGLFPTVFATYRVNDEPDAVVDVHALSEDVLRSGLEQGRWEAAELRALQSAFADHGVPVVGMGRPTLRSDGIEATIVVVADLTEASVRDVQGRLDAATTAWVATRTSGAFPQITGEISSLSISLVTPERLQSIPPAPTELPTVARLSHLNSSRAMRDADIAHATVIKRDDGSLGSVSERLGPSLTDDEEALLSERTLQAAQIWVTKTGLDHTVNKSTVWRRYERDTLNQVRIYVLLCAHGVPSCNTSSSDRAIALTVDLTTLKATDLRLVEATKLPGGGWKTPLEPERFE